MKDNKDMQEMPWIVKAFGGAILGGIIVVYIAFIVVLVRWMLGI